LEKAELKEKKPIHFFGLQGKNTNVQYEIPTKSLFLLPTIIKT
jgi:hypothetical protein